LRSLILNVRLIGILSHGQDQAWVSKMGNLGVAITKQALLDNIKGSQFLSNKGSVFGVQKGKNHILIRASESKFHTHECKGKIGHGWTDINRNNFIDFKNNSIDFFCVCNSMANI
jgi:hypothetical protein